MSDRLKSCKRYYSYSLLTWTMNTKQNISGSSKHGTILLFPQDILRLETVVSSILVSVLTWYHDVEILLVMAYLCSMCYCIRKTLYYLKTNKNKKQKSCLENGII